MLSSTRWALVIVCFALALSVGPRAHAQSTCSLPYQLQNGQIADASQVMANFNALAGCLGVGVATVPNNTGLIAASPSPGATVYRAGFTAAGDGGGGMYAFTSTPCSLNGGEGDNGSQVVSRPPPRPIIAGCWILDPALGFVTPKTFGAVVDGMTDDSGALQAAASYLCTTTPNATLIFTVGTIKAHDINITCALNVRGVGNGRSILDYSAATSYGLRWLEPSFPVTGISGELTGGSLNDLTMKDTSSTATGVIVKGFYQWSSKNVYLNGPYIGIFAYGNNGISLDHWYQNNTRSIGYYFKGDLAGVDASNVACTTSTVNCTTFSTVVVLSDLQNGNVSGTPTGIKIEGATFTVEGEHFSFEKFGTGVSISCPLGLNANMTQCPHFITLTDLQVENHSNSCVTATDFLDLKLIEPYCYGLVTSPNSIVLGSLAYASSASPPGKVKISHGMMFSVANDCFLGTSAGPLSDVSISDMWISGCGSSADNTYQGINLQSTTNVVDIGDNQFCSVNGFPSGTGTEAHAIQLGTNVAAGFIHDNTFLHCHAGILNSSSTPYAITEHNNHGPGGLPSIASGCGTSGATVTGTDQAMSVALTAGATGTCVINFGTNPQMRAPVCSVTAQPGASATVSASASTSQATISGPTAGTYALQCSTG